MDGIFEVITIGDAEYYLIEGAASGFYFVVKVGDPESMVRLVKR